MLPENQKSPRTRSHASKPLRRGRACMNCRLLKIKCDGVKPVCGPCLQHPKDDECEYTDGQSRSRTKILEETVSRLVARVHELEHPDETTPSVILHDPYIQYNQSQQFSDSPVISTPESLPYSSLSPISSSNASIPSGMQWNLSTLPASMTHLAGSNVSLPALTQTIVAPSVWELEEPPQFVTQTLLDNFLPHSSEFGFFLDIPRFRNCASLLLPFGDNSRPTKALLCTVYLWGIHLSQSEPFTDQEPVMLSRALQNCANDLLTAHPQKILHTIQAEVLLAYYFFRTGRFLEAKYHTAGAVSLALSAGFHKIRSMQPSPQLILGVVVNQAITLEPAQDDVEQGERINGFWATFVLHKILTVALNPPSNVCGVLEAPGMLIDTPWPLDIESYKEGGLSPELQGACTVRNFLNNMGETGGDGFSTTAMSVKASILFHKAAYLAGQWSPGMHYRDTQAYLASFQALNYLIDNFRTTLPPLSQFDANHAKARTLIVTHALTDAATIKLHSTFASADLTSRQNCLAAARAMVRFGTVNIQDFRYINPVMGTLWMTACDVLANELLRVRAVHGGWAADAPVTTEEDLLAGLRSGLTAMSMFAADNLLMRYQLTKIQEIYSPIS